MKTSIRKLTLLLVLISFKLATGSVILDFTTDDNGVPLVNGQHIETPGEFGNLVSVTSFRPIAIFDTDPGGPNAAMAVTLRTDDMLVGLGNALIIQSVDYPDQTVAGIYDTPVDRTSGGIMYFDFVSPVTVESVDLIDVDSRDASVKLTDTGGLTRTYNIPPGWTNDLRVVPNGFATLDLTTLADQTGETAVLATASEDAGFDASSVSRLEVRLNGSGGIDNVVFVPEPSCLALIGMGMLGLIVRRVCR